MGNSVEWRSGGLSKLLSTLTLTLTLRAALISYEVTYRETTILDLLEPFPRGYIIRHVELHGATARTGLITLTSSFTR